MINIRTNLPKNSYDFILLDSILIENFGCRLGFDVLMEKYINGNNVFFQCDDLAVAHINALYRSLLGMDIITNGASITTLPDVRQNWFEISYRRFGCWLLDVKL